MSTIDNMGDAAMKITTGRSLAFLGAALQAAVAILYFPLPASAAPGDPAIYGAEDDGDDNVDGQFGPYDYYRAPTKPVNAIALVEHAHMGFVIADQLRTKDYCGYFGSLRYTLRAFPNHPRALKLMVAFLDMHPPCNLQPSGRRQAINDLVVELSERRWDAGTADSYFYRALNFMTEDTRVIPKHAETHVLYGDWLRQKGRRDEAMKQYQAARTLDPRSSAAHYGLGMLDLEKNDLPSAVAHAGKAYSLGKPPGDLRDRLISAGAWPTPRSGKDVKTNAD
jgi:tetratricopeptide (TPR) repeat protein